MCGLQKAIYDPCRGEFVQLDALLRDNQYLSLSFHDHYSDLYKYVLSCAAPLARQPFFSLDLTSHRKLPPYC